MNEEKNLEQLSLIEQNKKTEKALNRAIKKIAAIFLDEFSDEIVEYETFCCVREVTRGYAITNGAEKILKKKDLLELECLVFGSIFNTEDRLLIHFFDTQQEAKMWINSQEDKKLIETAMIETAFEVLSDFLYWIEKDIKNKIYNRLAGAVWDKMQKEI